MQRMKPCDPKHPSNEVLRNLRKKELGGMPWLAHTARVLTGFTSKSDYNIYHEADRFFQIWRERDWVMVASLTAKEAVQRDSEGLLIEWIEAEIAIDMLKESSR